MCNSYRSVMLHICSVDIFILAKRWAFAILFLLIYAQNKTVCV